MKVLFFGRAGCWRTTQALNYLIKLGFDVSFTESVDRKASLKGEIGSWEGDYIFCFRSLFVVPKSLLEKAKIASVNFHPAPPEYPGSGCLNFALYDQKNEYGVTSHLMTELIDDGRIIKCVRFPITENDSVSTLLERTHDELLALFYEVTREISSKGVKFINKALKESFSEKWDGPARKLAELNEMQKITSNISEMEMGKIVRATFTEAYPTKLLLHGYEFVLKNAHKSRSRESNDYYLRNIMRGISQSELDEVLDAQFIKGVQPKINLHGYDFVLLNDKKSTN